MNSGGDFSGRILVVAFEGWNDAGEAASRAVSVLLDQLELVPIAEFGSETLYDYQLVRPHVGRDAEGQRQIEWPVTKMYAPLVPAERVDDQAPEEKLISETGLRVTGGNERNIYLLLGPEPTRNWQSFSHEVIELAQAANIRGVVLLGALLADVPHSRSVPIFASSENSRIRSVFDLERSSYEGPVGILTVIADAAEKADLATISLWASVPHYVHHIPSPKAALALIDKLEEIIDVSIPRGDLMDEAAEWEAGIDAMAAEDDDMRGYIATLESSSDAISGPRASAESLAEEFERFLRSQSGETSDGGPSGLDGPERPS